MQSKRYIIWCTFDLLHKSKDTINQIIVKFLNKLQTKPGFDSI